MVVLLLMDLNCRQYGRGSNRSWAWWDESWEMRLALHKSRSWHNDSKLGRSPLIILEVVFTTLFDLSFSFTVIDPNHAVVEMTEYSITALEGQYDLCGQTKWSEPFLRVQPPLDLFENSINIWLPLLEFVEPRNLKCWIMWRQMVAPLHGARKTSLGVVMSGN